MRSPREESTIMPAPADAVFAAALGVVQQAKRMRILAVHNSGHRLAVREKGKFSNPKFFNIWVDEENGATRLNVVVGTDPRSPKALLDGKANDKALKDLLEGVRGALDGSAPAPVTPVADHFLQKKTEVPWTDPTQDPEIELDGNILAMYGR